MWRRGGKGPAGKEYVLARSDLSQTASTAVKSEFKKPVEVQMHLMSVSAHPLDPRAATAGESWEEVSTGNSSRHTLQLTHGAGGDLREVDLSADERGGKSHESNFELHF
jgi:hypothetical protein